MALEGLAALSVASNIAQFVDFGCRLFFETKELYNSSSGLANESMELENISQTLGRLSNGLMAKNSFGDPPSSGVRLDEILHILPANTKTIHGDEKDLISLAQQCQKVAEELSGALNQLRINGPGKKWECFRVSLKRIWKAKRIDKIAKRMERLSSQLTVCLVKVLT